MNVAHVVGAVDLHSDGIHQELTAELKRNVPVDAISREIAEVVNNVVSERFPMFANRAMFQMIEQSVRAEVARKGPELVSNVIPRFEVPQPPPDVRNIKLLQTIKDLWNSGTTGDATLAVAIAAFTVFFPITKYIALTWLVIGGPSSGTRSRVLAWLKSWGQWSMGDVFVVAFIVVFTKINTSVVSTSTLAEITVRVGVEPGMYLFASSVILAMICSMLLTTAHD